MDRDISPPPVKRRKLAPSTTEQPESTDFNGRGLLAPTSTDAMKLARTIRVFSWNVNGITPYLPPQTTKITSFFKPSNPKQSKSASHPKSNKDNLRALLSRHNWPEVLFLQELKIQPGDTKTLAALLSSLNTPLNPQDTLSPSRSYTLDAVLPRDRYNARGFQGKLYGVGTVLRTDFARKHVARVREVEWDLEGRVSVVELRGPRGTNPKKGAKQHRPLALLNIYAVNGTSAPYRSPTEGRVIGTRHDHKLAFHRRLRDECLSLEIRGFDVVVAGDLNIARGPWDGHPNLRTFPKQHCVNRADFNGLFFGEGDNKRAGAYVGSGFGRTVAAGSGDKGWKGDGGEQEQEKRFDGVDVWRAMYGSERRYTYYPRTREWGSSCDRVDMVIVSRGSWESGRVKRTGILDTPQERGLSDHVPLWVEVEVGEVGREDDAGERLDGG